MKLHLAAILPTIASAFVSSSINSQHVPTRNALTELSVTTGANGKAAASKEEDLALTLQIIMENLSSQDNNGGVVDDDDDDDGKVTESPKAAEKKEKKQKKKKTPPQPAVPEEIDVSKLDIRVGIIQDAWAHEEADKLFCEKIDIGEKEPRSIASGLRAYYKVEDLVGKRVCVLANLKERKLVGFPSHGMVLCASNDDTVKFVEPPADASIGERIMCAGYDGEAATENQVANKKKKILDTVFPDLKTDSNGVACYKGVPLTAGTGSCVAEDGLSNASIS